MEMNNSISSDDDPDDSIDQSVSEVTFGFNHLQIDNNDAAHSEQLTPDAVEIDDVDQDHDDEEEEEEGDFTFVCIGGNDLPTTQVLEDGQNRPVFPLFDQSLLSGGDYDEAIKRLPIHVPVDNVFIESPRRSPSSMASGDEKTEGVTAGTFRALPKESGTGTPEINMKSNSTGFSKLWRFRDKMNRSNSDGRDAFVFLDRTTTSSNSDVKPEAVAGSTAKLNGAGVGKEKVVKKGSKAKKATASAHEVYLKQRGGQTEEERRRSFLPYRPGLMGFFTNVNGGLSKNVHPF